MKNSKKSGVLKIIINLNVYPLDAVYSTAYIFINQAYIFLDSAGRNKVAVFLKGKKKLTKKQSEKLKGEFLNELLNYALRNALSKNNKKIRERIIERALYSSVTEEDVWLDDEDDTSDPMGIATPWEEKNN